MNAPFALSRWTNSAELLGRIMNNFFLLQWKKADVAKKESSEVPKIERSLRMKQGKVNAAAWCAALKPILLHRPQKNLIHFRGILTFLWWIQPVWVFRDASAL